MSVRGSHAQFLLIWLNRRSRELGDPEEWIRHLAAEKIDYG